MTVTSSGLPRRSNESPTGKPADDQFSVLVQPNLTGGHELDQNMSFLSSGNSR